MYFDRFVAFATAIEKAHKTVQKIKTERMRMFGLRSSDAMCLVILSRHPEGLTLTALAKECRVDKAAVSRALRTLLEAEAVRYLTVSDSKTTYRAPIVLTEKGKSIAVQMNALAGDAIEHSSGEISSEQLTAFYDALNTIAENLERYAARLEQDADTDGRKETAE